MSGRAKGGQGLRKSVNHTDHKLAAELFNKALYDHQALLASNSQASHFCFHPECLKVQDQPAVKTCKKCQRTYCSVYHLKDDVFSLKRNCLFCTKGTFERFLALESFYHLYDFMPNKDFF